jgi:ketosteroid isomerase-like protein
MAPHHDSVQGPPAVERVLRKFGEAGWEDLRLETSHVEYSGDLALEVGRYTMATRQANGTTLLERGKFLHAWRRLGVWLMVANSWSSNLPPVAK